MPVPFFRVCLALTLLPIGATPRNPLYAQNCAPEANKVVIRRFVEEAFTKRNLAIFDTLVAPDLQINGRQVGRDAFRQSVADLHHVWADLRTDIRLMVAEGDLVATYLAGSGTQVGPFAGIQPTGRRVHWDGMTISRIENGKIQERWSVFDWDEVFRQLTAAPGRSN